MIKGLEALEEISLLVDVRKEHINKYLNIIEKELKDKEKFDNFMKRYNLNSIEELDDFFNQCLNKEIEKCSKCKELKALDIIKRVLNIPYKKVEIENWEIMRYITKEEYALLKEVGL